MAGWVRTFVDMSQYSAANAKVRVFTFKEGLLSAVAHDLEIDVPVFKIDVEGETVQATFFARSLRVLHAMDGATPKPSALSERDKKTIESNIAGDVLQSARYPEIRFEGTAKRSETSEVEALIEGTLSIAGRSRQVRIEARLDGEQWRAETTLHQPDFGIKPYSAMLGALKIKPDVRVTLSLSK